MRKPIRPVKTVSSVLDRAALRRVGGGDTQTAAQPLDEMHNLAMSSIRAIKG